MTARTPRALLHVALAGALLLAPMLALTASAGATTSDALLRGAHFSPDTPGVDVYLTAFSGGTSKLWLSKVGYGDVSPYRRVTPGLYAVAMRLHGAKASTPAALTWTLDARPGNAYTAAAVGLNKQLKGIVLRDDLTQPRRGFGSVRVIQAASRAPHVDVVAQDGPTIAHSTSFGTETAYAAVPAGSWPLVARSVEDPAIQARADVKVPAGAVETVVVLDSSSRGIAVRALLDAAGASAVPVGAVPAGGGGTAIRPGSGTDWLVVGLMAAGGLLALTGLALRRGSPRAE